MNDRAALLGVLRERKLALLRAQTRERLRRALSADPGLGLLILSAALCPPTITFIDQPIATTGPGAPAPSHRAADLRDAAGAPPTTEAVR